METDEGTVMIHISLQQIQQSELINENTAMMNLKRHSYKQFFTFLEKYVTTSNIPACQDMTDDVSLLKKGNGYVK